MPRYFIELAYKGTAYSGFQVQKNANSIQAEVEKALAVLFRQQFELTGSSRTDAGVHALQNFFHFDSPVSLTDASYQLNAILPGDIVIKRLFPVDANAHCRFDALSREYKYNIYHQKDPFLFGTAYYFPYTAELKLLREAASIIKEHTDFTSFSKRNTQVKSFLCNIYESEWKQEDGCLVYQVKANRFLRGMVKGLVGTMLQVGRGKLTIGGLKEIIKSKDASKADFSVPSHALFLNKVNFK